jgi:ABC-type transporter Mla subunit MlaD
MTDNNNEISYFKIGTFVLLGLGLIVFALLVFGSSKMFQPIVYVETYFEESIQGISEGTPVKYRGLQIGYIKEIAFTSEIYKNNGDPSIKIHNRSIYVKIAITSKLFTQLGNKVTEMLSEEVAQGLRVKLVTQGLTGTSYLEFDYINPKSSKPPTAITWHPINFYVPSATSTLARLSENAQYIMNELKDINFKKIFQDIDQLTISLSKMAESSITQINNPLETTLQNFKTISSNLRVVSEQLKLNPSSMVFGKSPPPLDPSKL